MNTYTFFSYNKDDKEIASDIISKLEARNVNVWHDGSLKSGLNWKKQIFQAIIDCDSMVVCLTKSYIKSAMCRMEIFLAQCYNKKILPIMVKEECWEDLNSSRELSSIKDLSVLNLVKNEIFGLKVTEEDQLNKLVGSINNEIVDRFDNCELFISYKAKDAQYATKVADDLFQLGIQTWIATLAYKPGENWQSSQWEALMQVKGLAVILSKDVAQSEYIRKEILIAITRNIPIYPVLVDDSIIVSIDFLREINEELDATRSFEMREINELQWFYPNRGNYSDMINSLGQNFEK
ncbi:toll/interleukin-1 receptor domain-containing protein [Aquiflexum sp. TKW24L]|uniref:toll/interleukin-1 receptor domain-containing protein n=1 Tax=Aquiflexum sp. TKW24L TaxID=2942212 RepID=UPI0020BF5AE2|nr:toll/interleukin-1 receptor domain-containing protein [Aquiflexum sp. TKW24L]MCL6257456.1 toll/interleukin-1 receptor domain-containing protein [Aquiflexum sp. TKW24L]